MADQRLGQKFVWRQHSATGKIARNFVLGASCVSLALVTGTAMGQNAPTPARKAAPPPNTALFDRISGALNDSFGPIFDFERTLVAYKDFPFPDVPRGEMWTPTLTNAQVTTFVPTGNFDEFPQAAKDILTRAKTLTDGGNGAAAIALLQENLGVLPDGSGQQQIGDIYWVGAGGVAQNKALGGEWYEKAAMFDPHLYLWLGATLGNSEEDIKLKLHFWSKGVLRGCNGCYGRLEALTRTKKIPDGFSFDEFFASGNGRRTRDVTEKVVPDSMLALYGSYALDAGSVMGRADTKTNMRTGLVPANYRLAQTRLRAGNYAGAANTLVFYETGGPYFSRVANRVMSRMPPGVINEALTNTITVRTVDAGDATHAGAAALIYKNGFPLLRRKSDGNYETYRPATSPDTVWRYYLGIGTNAERVPPEVYQSLNASVAADRTATTQVQATRAVRDARQCLDQAARSATATIETWLNCKSGTFSAWSGTDEVGFGRLDDNFFARLRSSALAAQQAEYDRRLRVASDRMTTAQAQRENPRTDFSGGVTSAGTLRQQNDNFARLNPQNFRNMPAYHPQVEDWERGYRAQRDRVATGRPRATIHAVAIRGSAQTCAIWSMKVMPFCSAEAMTLPTSSSAATTGLPQPTTAAACKARYDQIAGRINNTAPGIVRVTDAEISWAFDYEYAVRAGKVCP